VNATRILWGQVLTVCSIALAFIWAATQWTAAQLGYQAQLGHPWFLAGRYPVYHPPAFFWWWFAYDAYALHVFQTGPYIAAAGGLASVVVAIAMSVWRAREAKHSETYGTARWRPSGRFAPPACWGKTACCSASLGRPASGTRDPSTSCVSRPHGPARAWVSSSRPC
jgi:type IV secretion system protein VirD4